MPHQEIYLALLDQQASAAMADMETMLRSPDKAAAAQQRAKAVAGTIEAQYYDAEKSCYAFSRNADGSLDRASTVYPALAWWSDTAPTGKIAGLAHPAGCLQQFAAHTLNTDWGLRDVSSDEKFYDGMSYHQGSVWPLFTGWAAIAQYHSGNALAGYQSAMQNADLTHAQDIGAVTELLSGDLFEPFGRSTSHQLWSSAMVITPVLRGMFGIGVDALKHEVSVDPHLPADWDTAEVKRIHVGDAVVDLSFRREHSAMIVSLRQSAGAKVHLAGASGDGATLRLPLPAVEVTISHGLPLPGARTAQLKVLSESHEPHSLRLELEAIGGTESILTLRHNDAKAEVKVEGAKLDANKLHVSFARGTGYVTQVVTIRW
jgi:hypothetical protein